MSYILGISNPTTRHYVQQLIDVYDKETTVLVSEAELEELFKKQNLEEVEACFIQASLVWSGRSALHFHGFNIARKLRRHGLRCVIQMITPFGEEHFDHTFPRYALMKVPKYHQLLKLTPSKEELIALPKSKMSVELLNDIKDSLLDIPSIVHEIIHDLKNQLSFESKDFEEAIENELTQRTEQSFSQLYTLLPDKKPQLQQIRDELIESCIDLSDINFQEKIQLVLENITNQILELAPTPEQVEHLQLPRYTRWSVLFVDDDENIRSILKSGLRRNYIPCQLAKNADEVLRFLEEDKKKNRVTILICDVRLIDPSNGKWQDGQGYDIIKAVQKNLPNHLAYFVLTSGRSRLLRITESYKVNVYAHYKRDVISSAGALNLFSDKVREIGEQVFFTSRSQPDLTTWQKPTRRFYKPHSFSYKNHLADIDYEYTEECINQEAANFVQNVLDDLPNEKKQWIITISAPTSAKEEKAALNKFRMHILLARRIALGLYVNGFSEEEIFDLMHNTNKISNRKSSKDILFKTTLALSFLNDFPTPEDLEKGHYLKSRLLLEEIEWLIDQYQTNFDFNQIQLNQNDWDILSQILENLQSRIQKKCNTTPDDPLFKLNLDKLTTKTAAAYFRKARKAAETYQLFHSLKQDIESDIDELHNSKIVALLNSIIE